MDTVTETLNELRNMLTYAFQLPGAKELNIDDARKYVNDRLPAGLFMNTQFQLCAPDLSKNTYSGIGFLQHVLSGGASSGQAKEITNLSGVQKTSF